MATPNMNRPIVYMFKQDEEIIKKLVAEHKGGDTSGDLFGLWTEDSEPVIHLVTGHSGMEKKSFKRSGTSTKIGDTEKEIRRMLCENYCLPRIGKWQCRSDTDQYRRELEKSIREDKLLLRKEQNYALIITAHCDNSNLSPYIVSKKSISTIGKIEFLQGENPFRKVGEIRKMIGDSSVQNDDWNESEGDVEMNPFLADEAIPGKSDFDSLGGEDRTRESRPLPELANFTANDLKVYMFEEDIAMVQKLVLLYPDVETGGDLFGLWTEDSEPVIHLVTGHSGMEKKSFKRSGTSTKIGDTEKEIRRMLCENYCLPRIGKWQCRSDTDQYRRELEKSIREDKLLLRKEQNYALIITAHCDNSNLSPYIVSKKSISTIGKIEFLQGENPFRKVAEIRKMIGDSSAQAC